MQKPKPKLIQRVKKKNKKQKKKQKKNKKKNNAYIYQDIGIGFV